MILFDTNSPETGQAAQHGLRNSLTDKATEESIEFSEVWSEVIEQDTPKPSALLFAQSSVAIPTEASLDQASPDTEVTGVRPEFHTEEAEPTELEGAQTKPLSEASQMVSEIGDTIPETRETTAMIGVLGRSQMLGSVDPEVAQTPYVRARSAAQIVIADTANPAQPITVADDAMNRTPTTQQAVEAATVQDKAAVTHQMAVGVSVSNPISVNAKDTHTQFQSLPDLGRFPVQMTEGRQHRSVPTSTEGADSQSTRAVPVIPLKTDQSAPLATAPIPARLTDQQQRNGPLPTHLSEEHTWVSQPIADSNPAGAAKIPSLLPSAVPMDEPTTHLQSAVPDVESFVSLTQKTGMVSTSATAAATPQSNAPQVAAQIIAAVSQSSGSRTEILLNPEELGRVRISLSSGDAGITVSILTERAETADLMRRNVELLERDLRDMGYENPSFTFGERSDGSNEKWDDESTEPDTSDPNAAPELPTPYMRVTLNGGLDLKL